MGKKPMTNDIISLLTDKNAFYLLTAFGISTVILLFNLWLPLKQRRQIFHRLKAARTE